MSDAQGALQTIDQQVAAQKADKQTAIDDSFVPLAKSATMQWSDFQKQYPDYAQKLLDQTGMDPTQAALKWNASKNLAQQIQWSAPQKTADGFLIYGTNPLTGQLESQTIHAPIGGNWDMKLTTDGTAYSINKDTGDIKTYTDGAWSAPGQTFDKTTFESAITSQESGNYSAVNKDSGALGAYQIMPSHLPEIGLKNTPEDQAKFLASPELQNKLFHQITDGLATKYGNNMSKMAAAYYGGDGAASIVGTPAGDKKQGSYPSINDYVKSVLGKIDAQGSSTSGTKDPSQMTSQELKRQQRIDTLKRTEQLTDSAAVMMDSRRSTIVNNTLRSLYPAGKNPIQVFNSSAQVIDRVDASLQRALDPANTAKNVADLDLLDSYVQIARGGGQVTEAQVDTLVKGMGLGQSLDIAKQKINGGATLSDDQRKELASLSKEIYKKQEVTAQKGVDQINSLLKKRGMPDSMMFDKPTDLVGIENDNPLPDTSTIQQLSGQLQPGEILATDSSGNVVAATQSDIDNGDYTALNQ